MKIKDQNNHHHIDDKDIAEYFASLRNARRLNLSYNSKKHLSECLICKQKMMDLYDSVNTISQENIQMKKKLYLKVSSYSAVASIVLFAFILFLSNETTVKVNAKHSPHSPKKDLVVVEKSETKKELKSSEEFAINQFYESLENQYYRNSNLPSLSGLKKEYKSNDSFEVVVNNVNEGATIKIINNKDEEIIKEEISGDLMVLIAPKNRGKYYVLLESETEILFVSSFIVN